MRKRVPLRVKRSCGYPDRPVTFARCSSRRRTLPARPCRSLFISESHVKLTKLAVGAGLIVVSIDYRLAPENPYPAPLDDWVAAFRWVRENAASLGGDQARVSIGGDSAGGSLAATTTLRLLAEGGKPPNSVLMICPSADLAMQTDSIRTLSPDDPIPGNALHGILPRLLRAGRWAVERPVSQPTCRRPFGFPSYLRRRWWHRPSPR